MSLRIGVVTASISRIAGGMFTSVRRLSQEIAAGNSCDVKVFSLRDRFTDTDSSLWLPLSPSIFETVGPKSFGFAPKLLSGLRAAGSDLIHTHGIWMYPSAVAVRSFRQSRKPYLVSPRGMLDKWAMAQGSLKKRLALFLFEREHFHHAACVQALCGSEVDSIRSFGYKGPICVIPNGVDIPVSRHDLGTKSSKILLFLGRLHPKKNILALLKAWGMFRLAHREAGWVLQIAGWDQGGYESVLKRFATDNGLLSVEFLGPLFGEEKEAAYKRASAVVLPSLSEGLPVSILEAWSYGKPVLMTPACNLPDGFGVNAALLIGTQPEQIFAGLEALDRIPANGLRIMGEAGFKLVAQSYSWAKIGADMSEVYRWLLKGDSVPPSVRF